MNSASRGLRPMVGLRRPGDVFCVGGGRRLARCAWEGRFQSAGRPSADGRPAPTGRCLLRRRRPTPGAVRLGRPISIGVKAFGPRSACADRKSVLCVGGGRRLARCAWEGRFQSAWRPLADGRPAPTGRAFFASAEADAWRGAPWKADFNRREGLRPMVGLRRPEERSLRRRRPMPGAARLRRPISIGGKAFGRWSACADRENPFASAKADARRASAW